MVGLDITPSEMSSVCDLETSDLRASASLQLFTRLGCPFDVSEDLIKYYRQHKHQPRPDGFKYMEERAYFWARLVGYLVPFAALYYQPSMVPGQNGTPFEQSVYRLTTGLGYATAAIAIAMLAQFGIIGAGITTDAVSIFEVLTIHSGLVGLVWATQCSRELAKCKTEIVGETRMRKSIAALRATTLKLTNGKVIKGFNVLLILAKATPGFEKSSWAFLFYITQPTCLSYFNSKKNAAGGGRRRSSMIDEVEALRGKDADADERAAEHNKRRNLCSASMRNIVPYAVGLMIASVGTVTKELKGEPNVVSTEASRTRTA
jgi:hypothetical protein